MLTRNDFMSNQEVRWCPGCGDYAILAAMQKTLPEIGIPKENIVFISGIGCSGRFPYYMNTYGFHTIHGRAPAVASGLKMTRPELSVWVVTGDGDGLSIGANHLLHALRRNIDIKILLLNNRIYGLTKGQHSPTTEQGEGYPLNPTAFALTAGATFVARVLDIDAKGLSAVIKAAAQHKGAAFVEIYQNCHIFNDGAFAKLTDKATRDQNMLWLDETGNDDLSRAFALSQQVHPVPMGIFRAVEKPVYQSSLTKHKPASTAVLNKLLKSGHTWDVV